MGLHSSEEQPNIIPKDSNGVPSRAPSRESNNTSGEKIEDNTANTSQISSTANVLRLGLVALPTLQLLLSPQPHN